MSILVMDTKVRYGAVSRFFSLGDGAAVCVAIYQRHGALAISRYPPLRSSSGAHTTTWEYRYFLW